jgi:hypothetical protein
LPKQFDEAKKLHALLQNPPPGTDRFQLRSAHEQLKTIAEALKQSSETLIGICAVMVAFSGILGLAFTGWVYKATTNLLLLGVRNLVYSPLISALGMFLIPLFVAVPILNEIVKGSDPERLSRYGHRDQGVSLLVVAWWLAMVAAIGASFYLLTQMPTDQQIAAGQQLPKLPLLLSSGICALSYILGIWLVGSVNSNQLVRLEIAQSPSARPAVAVTAEFESKNG